MYFEFEASCSPYQQTTNPPRQHQQRLSLARGHFFISMLVFVAFLPGTQRCLISRHYLYRIALARELRLLPIILRVCQGDVCSPHFPVLSLICSQLPHLIKSTG